MILIPTYNRPGLLSKLLVDIKVQTERKVVIVDDGSDVSYRQVKTLLDPEDEFISMGNNHGKQQYYKVVNKLFEQVRGHRVDYVFKLDDDLRLQDNAIERAIQVFDSIPDHRKQVMNLLNDGRIKGPSWNGVEPEKKGNVWQSGWIDMIWMAKREFLESFGFKLHERYFEDKRENGFWDDFPHRSSQVGKWLTLSLYSPGKFWSIDERLVHHGSHDSKMNPVERRINPITNI